MDHRDQKEPQENSWDSSLSPMHSHSTSDFNIPEAQTSETQRRICYAVVAAATGDLQSLKRCEVEGLNLSLGDYDMRTPLHLACAEGHVGVVNFLLDDCNVSVYAHDRWGCTPIVQAQKSQHHEIVKILTEHMKSKGLIVEANLAACCGDLATLKSLAEGGLDMNESNSDGRTPLHLACAEGHEDIVRYLLFQCQVDQKCQDRWGQTPYRQAINARHAHILSLFKESLQSKIDGQCACPENFL